MEEYTETGRTFVISTHIIEEAADLMEEVIMIKDGSLLLKENTQDLLERSYHVSGLAEVVDQAAEGYCGDHKGTACLGVFFHQFMVKVLAHHDI